MSERKAASLRIVPCSLRRANDFVEVYHRHNLRTARDGGKFACAVSSLSSVVGVAIVGNPLSATLMDGFTAEVLRVCVRPDAPRNCNSFLYGACRRIWFAMGGTRIITYTLTDESGESLRGAGWKLADVIRGHRSDWGKSDHIRRSAQPIFGLTKRRWEAVREAPDKHGDISWPNAPREIAGGALLFPDPVVEGIVPA